MQNPMTAKIALNDSPIPFYYTINSFFYDTINGDEYLVLDRKGAQVVRFKVDDIECFQLSAIHPD